MLGQELFFQKLSHPRQNQSSMFAQVISAFVWQRNHILCSCTTSYDQKHHLTKYTLAKSPRLSVLSVWQKLFWRIINIVPITCGNSICSDINFVMGYLTNWQSEVITKQGQKTLSGEQIFFDNGTNSHMFMVLILLSISGHTWINNLCDAATSKSWQFDSLLS